MTESEIRDELVQILAQKRMHTNESLGKQGAAADLILASPVIRRIQAEAWDEGVAKARESYECDYHDPWKRLGDNPYIERGETA